MEEVESVLVEIVKKTIFFENSVNLFPFLV